MSVIGAVRDYIAACPLLEGRSVNINYLGAQLPSYSIDSVKKAPVIKRYCDGGELRQRGFVFAVRDSYDEDSGQNLKAAELLEKLADWIDKQNETGNLPVFPENTEKVQFIEAGDYGVICDAAGGSARYELQFGIVYRK